MTLPAEATSGRPCARRGRRIGRMRRVFVPALILALAGCARTGSPAIGRADLAGFDAAALVDVSEPDFRRAVRSPSVEAASKATWLDDASPVVVVTAGDAGRAYPLAILVVHEVVNDRIGDIDVVVAYSPLSDSVAAYRRAAGPGLTLSFVPSGKLYAGGLVMLDEQTRTLWPHLSGTAVRGELKGATLDALPAVTVPWGAFRAARPDPASIARPSGFAYDVSPYPGYERRTSPDGDLFPRVADPRRPAMERVLGIQAGGEARAYPLALLARDGKPAVLADTVGGREIVIVSGESRRSVLDAREVGRARLVASAAAFEARLDGKAVRLEVRDERVVDAGTGSAWSVAGCATEGPLRGRCLAPARQTTAFWFAWAAQFPRTSLWAG